MGVLLFFFKSFGAKFAVNLMAATLGIVGTWLMSRRYAQHFWRNILYTILFPFLFLLGQAKHARNFFTEKIRTNQDLPESLSSMVLGIALLFWAFFFQLIALFLEIYN